MASEKRLIDAEPIKKFIVDGLNNPSPKEAFGYDATEILTEIEYAPTVDAVEVVRCKDCKHYHTHNRSVKWDTESMYCCKSALKKVCPDDFCSCGERRTNERKAD